MIKGLPWEVSAIGNAKFKGVLLSELLIEMGYKESDLKGKHLIAEG